MHADRSYSDSGQKAGQGAENNGGNSDAGSWNKVQNHSYYNKANADCQ